MSDIIKNPKRNSSRYLEAQKSEYERLGITPKKAIMGNYMSIKDLLNPDTGKIFNIGPEEDSDKKISEVSSIDNFCDEDKSSLNDSHIIDNNDYIFGAEFLDKENEQLSDAIDSGELIDFDSNNNDSKSLIPNVGDYILMIFGKIADSGKLSYIEDRVRKILYEEDDEFAESKVSQEDIIVLKRVDLQVGIFIKD